MRGAAAGSGQDAHANFRHGRRGQGVQQHIRRNRQNYQARGCAEPVQGAVGGDHASGDVHDDAVGCLHLAQR